MKEEREGGEGREGGRRREGERKEERGREEGGIKMLKEKNEEGERDGMSEEAH